MSKLSTGDICDTLNQINHDNWNGEEDAPDFVEELKACAYNIVRENPGIERSEWIDELIRQYPTEVVDAYGTNPREVFHDLSDLWEMEYTDPETHEWNSFAGWSEYLMTDPDALRDQLDRARERIRELETEIALLRGKANKSLSDPPNRADNINPHREPPSASESTAEAAGGENINPNKREH